MYPFPCVPSCCLELRQIKKSYANPALQTFAMRRTPPQPQEEAGAKQQAQGSSLTAKEKAIAHGEFKRRRVPPPHRRVRPKAVGHRWSPAARRCTGQSRARSHRSRRVREGNHSDGPLARRARPAGVRSSDCTGSLCDRNSRMQNLPAISR